MEALTQGFQVAGRCLERKKFPNEGNGFPADIFGFQKLVAPSLNPLLDNVPDAHAMLVGEYAILDGIEFDSRNCRGKSLLRLLGAQAKVVGKQIGSDIGLHRTDSTLSLLLRGGARQAAKELPS